MSRLDLGPTQPPQALYSGVSSWDMRLTTYLHLLSQLRMSGALLPLPIYAFMASSDTTSCFTALNYLPVLSLQCALLVSIYSKIVFRVLPLDS
jgi:hypothetical protein